MQVCNKKVNFLQEKLEVDRIIRVMLLNKI